MYANIFATVAPVFICIAVGYGWHRSGVPFESEFVSRIVTNIGAPCLIIGTISKVGLPKQALMDFVVATVLLLTLTIFAAALICRLLSLPYNIYLTALSFPNIGNMGLPICFYAFGDEGLAAALGIFLIFTIVQFSAGVALVSGQSAWRSTLASPMVHSGLIATVLVAGSIRLPLWLENSANLLGAIVIPLMLVTLGVSLSQLRISDFSRSLALGFLRLAIGLVVGLVVAELLALEGALRGAVIIQSAMPSAVLNYLLALRYQRSPETVASLVVLSTLLSFISLPLLLWLVI